MDTKPKTNTPRRSVLRPNEVVLVILIALLAGLGMYFSSDENTALGILDTPIVNTELPVLLAFSTPHLSEQPFLDVDLRETERPEQVEVRLIDALNPPPVEDLAARTTRVGGEVYLTWTLPEGVAEVNIFRAARTVGEVESGGEAFADGTPSASTQEMVAERLAAESFLDEGLDEELVYTYRVMTYLEFDGRTVPSEARSVDVVARDEIAPAPPTDLVVTSGREQGQAGVLVRWAHPVVDDLASVAVYRSSVFGDRGTVVGRVQADEEPELFDSTAEPNELLFYTVVAVDEAGNESVDDFQLPPAGNTDPFEPQGDTSNDDDNA